MESTNMLHGLIGVIGAVRLTRQQKTLLFAQGNLTGIAYAEIQRNH